MNKTTHTTPLQGGWLLLACYFLKGGSREPEQDYAEAPYTELWEITDGTMKIHTYGLTLTYACEIQGNILKAYARDRFGSDELQCHVYAVELAAGRLHLTLMRDGAPERAYVLKPAGRLTGVQPPEMKGCAPKTRGPGKPQ